jgi:ABC-type Fe3+/spermidine/putrescine transport system ATPase subunit
MTGRAADTDATGHVLAGEGLTFHRGHRTILDDVTMRIAANERIAVVGPSGAGKTTLLRLLAGLEQPTSGSLRMPTAGAVRVGLLFQDLGLFPRMRVRTNVAFPLLARGVPRAQRRQRATAALEEAGLSHHANRFPSALSGGERQRVAIVRILLSEPLVLLLDEPFASLDPHLVDRFADWLEKVRASTEMPMVIVTHDIPFALRWADRLTVLAGGRIVQSGAPRNLYERPADEFVAGFLGKVNLVDAEVVTKVVSTGGDSFRCRVPGVGEVVATADGELAGGRCRLALRPHHLRLGGGRQDGLPATVVATEFTGSTVEVLVGCALGERIRVHADATAAPPAVGEQVTLRWPPVSAHAVATRTGS